MSVCSSYNSVIHHAVSCASLLEANSTTCAGPIWGDSPAAPRCPVKPAFGLLSDFVPLFGSREGARRQHHGPHAGFRAFVDLLWHAASASSSSPLRAASRHDRAGSKLEQPDFTASTRAGSPALIVVSEQTIPEAYWLPQPRKLDRQGLRGTKGAGEIPGAR